MVKYLDSNKSWVPGVGVLSPTASPASTSTPTRAAGQCGALHVHGAYMCRVAELVGDRFKLVFSCGLTVLHGRRQNEPRNTQESKQHSPQQRISARSSANLTLTV